MPRSVSDAAQFYQAEDGSLTEKLFWSQYAEAKHPVPMSDQLKQMVELHKAADQAMKGFIVWLWPGDALPNSFFDLVGGLWMPAHGWRSSSDPSALKVHAGLSPV